MRDSIGGTVSLVIVVMFIVVALGYLAYNINYTKAHRLKDEIIALYNENGGYCNSSCQNKIVAYAKEIGYATNNFSCPVEGTYESYYNLYCTVDHVISEASQIPGDTKAKAYKEIITKINLQIPVISNIIDFKFFYVRGDTKAYTVKG